MTMENNCKNTFAIQRTINCISTLAQRGCRRRLEEKVAGGAAAARGQGEEEEEKRRRQAAAEREVELDLELAAAAAAAEKSPWAPPRSPRSCIPREEAAMAAAAAAGKSREQQ